MHLTLSINIIKILLRCFLFDLYLIPLFKKFNLSNYYLYIALSLKLNILERIILLLTL